MPIFNIQGSNVEEKTIHVSTPKSNNNFPFLGNLYNRKLKAKMNELNREYELIIDYLYCFSMSEPDEILGYTGECDETVLAKFRKKSLEDKQKTLREQIGRLSDENRNSLIEITALLLKQNQDKVESIVKELPEYGGRRRTRRQKHPFRPTNIKNWHLRPALRVAFVSDFKVSLAAARRTFKTGIPLVCRF